MLVYEKNSLQASKLVTLDESNPYFQMIHQLWGEKLRAAFNSIAEPSWSGATPSRSIASPAKKMGAVPIHRASKSIALKVNNKISKRINKPALKKKA
jgi:putative proteasome-type protease